MVISTLLAQVPDALKAIGQRARYDDRIGTEIADGCVHFLDPHVAQGGVGLTPVLCGVPWCDCSVQANPHGVAPKATVPASGLHDMPRVSSGEAGMGGTRVRATRPVT
jgi:hypothetical protein